MAGEKITVIQGPTVKIRAVAAVAGAAGDYVYVERTPGFWLHDIEKGATGDLCVHAPIASIPNNGEKHKAGEVFLGEPKGINYGPNKPALQNKTPAHTNIVYQAVGSKAGRVLVVWGLY